ncbi:ATP-binding protein [Caproiciproducens sp. R2]|uniref:ATP-binding protein n=1 Tax=Caproiciproducens sp. R2 TaxID=3435187 RepID=UPI004033FBEE
MSEILQKSKFEKDFIERTYSSVVSDVSIAFSELVANSWDAGATKVFITLPNKKGDELIIEDNGTGMTEKEFQQRWMVIAYNRVAHQGEYVEYLSSKGHAKRLAYGRNGVGRHSMLCFDDKYCIETWQDGICNRYAISIDGGESAFSVLEHSTDKRSNHGTKLIVKAIKKIPVKSDVIKTLGYRFLFDPEFSVFVDGEKIEFQTNIEPIKQEILTLKGGKTIKISIYQIPDGEKTTAANGVAFWAGKRLVGNPSWNIGSVRVEDARRKFALHHLIVVQADCLINDVFYDWSHFVNTELVNETFAVVIQYTREFRVEYYKGKVSEVRKDVIRKNISKIETLSIPSLYDLKGFFENYLGQRPEIDTDELDIVINALISVLQSRNGISLLSKLSKMDVEDVDALNDILDEWSITDVKDVLDEIDQRLKVICAIEQLSGDSTTDELHVLHPLVSQAKWLFGIEYDNPNYTFNKTLTTVLQSLLMSQRKENVSVNWSKRPDLTLGSDFTLSATCTEDVDENEVFMINKILIIELKKGGFTIGRQEMNQAEEYIDSIYKGNKLNCHPKIKAFVVGDSVSSAISTKKTQEDYGEVYAYTYRQLVQTAGKRLFNLKDKLTVRYHELSAKDYLEEILGEPKQLELAE